MNTYIDNSRKVTRSQGRKAGVYFIAHCSLLIVIMIFITNTLNAQQVQSFNNKNYNDKVQTVLLHPTADSLAKPIIHLNDKMGKLHLQFDVLSNDAPYMYYTFIHCNND